MKQPDRVSPLKPGPSLWQESWLFLWEVTKVIIISLAIIVPIRYFLIQPFYVKGASMEPNFYDHEYLIVDQLTYRFFRPQRGQVVVFRYPRDPREYFIKRIIGLPQETVRVEGQAITIYNEDNTEGIVINEQYLPNYEGNFGPLEVMLKADEYFLMGDNRPESLDSRVFGPVKHSNIVGRVLLRGWPLNKTALFIESPKYGI